MAGSICISLIVVVFSILSAMAEGNILVYTMQMPRFIEEEFRDMPANFGSPLPSEGLRAMVVPGMPRDGCSPLQAPPTVPNFTGKWVVLIARYSCSFEMKVRNAQDAKFDGVIVHNVNSSELEIMSANNPMGIKIPSVFVSEDTGLILENNYMYPNKFYFVINGDLPFNVNTHLLLPFAIVVGVCLLIIIVITVVKCTRDRRRARRHRLPNSSLKKIPTCKFAKGDPYDTCAICLDDYVEGDKLRVLPCAHAYHCKCIDPWLTKNRRVCPVCKRKVFASGERTSRRGNPPSRGSANARDTHSDSDTDDDQAPLVRPTTTPTTQGGTFVPQRINPFVRAVRSSLAAASTPTADRVSPTSDRHMRGNTEDRSMTGQGHGQVQAASGSWPESSGSTRGAPFLAGVLNLKGENLHQPNRSTNPFEDEEAAVNPFETSRSPSLRTFVEEEHPRHKKLIKRVRPKRRGSDSTQTSNSNASTASSNDSTGERSIHENPAVAGDEETNRDRNSGQIGVAALPNLENIQPGNDNSRPSRNDFIV